MSELVEELGRACGLVGHPKKEEANIAKAKKTWRLLYFSEAFCRAIFGNSSSMLAIFVGFLMRVLRRNFFDTQFFSYFQHFENFHFPSLPF